MNFKGLSLAVLVATSLVSVAEAANSNVETFFAQSKNGVLYLANGNKGCADISCAKIDYQLEHGASLRDKLEILDATEYANIILSLKDPSENRKFSDEVSPMGNTKDVHFHDLKCWPIGSYEVDLGNWYGGIAIIDFYYTVSDTRTGDFETLENSEFVTGSHGDSILPLGGSYNQLLTASAMHGNNYISAECSVSGGHVTSIYTKE